jgi:hypothetical protein
MVDDESRVGMMVNQRGTRVQFVPAKDFDREFVGTAARRIRPRPGLSKSRPDSFVNMMRMPTVPGVLFQFAIVSVTAGSSGSTGLTTPNRHGCQRYTCNA